MHENALLADIGKAITAAALLGIPAYLLRVPLLLAYLAAGVLLGPGLGLGWIRNPENISTLSEIGLVLLMFILGLEINVGKLLQSGKAVIVNGITQFVGCVLLGAIYFVSLKELLGVEESFGRYGLAYLAVACALSSTLIVVKILSDRMELDSLTSRITLGILVIQDLWAIAFLAVQPDLAGMRPMTFLLSIGKAGLLVFTGWIFARFVLPRLLAIAGKQPELLLIFSLGWCFAVCGIASSLNLSLEMGALVAGVSIASFPYHSDVAAKVSSLRDFFIMMFFVGLGLQIPAPTPLILLLSGAIIAFVLLSRLLTVYPVLYWLGYGNRASLLPAIQLSQLSEFSLVFASLGVAYGHVSKDLLSAFIIALVTTALISSALFPASHELYRLLNPLLERIGFKDHFSKGTSEPAAESPETQPSVVFLGYHRETSSLLHELLARHSPASKRQFLVVDFNPEAHHKLREQGVPCKFGDISHIDTLRSLDLRHASMLLCTIPDHILKGTTNMKLLKQLRGLAPHAKVIVTGERLETARELYRAGADYVFVPRFVGAHHLADVLEKFRTDHAEGLKKGALAILEKRVEIIP